MASLQSLIPGKSIRRVVDALPILSTSRLQCESEWRRAYVVLGFISNSYIWGLEQPKEVGLSKILSFPVTMSYCINWAVFFFTETAAMHCDSVP